MSCYTCGSPEVGHTGLARNRYCCWCWVANGGTADKNHPYCRMAQKKKDASLERSITEELGRLRRYLDQYIIEDRAIRAVRGNERIEIIAPAENEWGAVPEEPAPDAIRYAPNTGPIPRINVRDGAANQLHNYYQRIDPYERFEPYPAPRAEIRGQRVGYLPPLRRNPGGMPMRNEVQQPREAPPDGERAERRDDRPRHDYHVVHEMDRLQHRHQDWLDFGPMGLRYRQQEVDPGGEPAGGPGPVQPDGVRE